MEPQLFEDRPLTVEEEMEYPGCSTIEPVPGDFNARLAVDADRRWPQGKKLRICFVDPEAASKWAPVVAQVKSLIMLWQPHINLRLEFSNDRNAEIRISFKGPAASSSVGKDSALNLSQPSMYLSALVASPAPPAAMVWHYVLHEFGHALGCRHEHQSPLAKIPWDMKNVYTEYAKYGGDWTKKAVVDAQIINHYNFPQVIQDEYDPNSIMLYPILKNTVLDPSFVHPRNYNLSPKDIAFIRKMYPQEIHYNLALYGKQPNWLNTGIELYQGQRARITATGTISFGPFGSWPFGPEGENKAADPSAPAPALLRNSLVAKAGPTPAYVGKDRMIQAQVDGPLYLAANDNFATDNDGAWNIHVQVFHR